MVTTQHTCARCSSEHIRRNGHSGGHARYPCKACGYQARFVPATLERTARYAQVAKLLAERNSQRSIVRVTGVARMTVAKRAKKSAAGEPRLASPRAEASAAKAVGSP
jgi:transposase-like protein